MRPKKVILCVDDNEQDLSVLKFMLTTNGYRVLSATTGQEALGIFQENLIDLVLVDFAMPQMNGMDLLRECKRLNQQQKTILLSGTVDEAIYARSDVKPDHFLAKPYQINQLVEVIHALIAK